MSGVATRRRSLPVAAKRGILAGVIVLLIAFVALGTRIVPNDDPAIAANQEFDPATYGAENFAAVQSGVAERAVDAAELAAAIAADPAAAAQEYAAQSSGGAVYSVTLTGVAGEAQSGVYTLAVDGVPSDLVIRVQTGPAINGTELRDATGEIEFGQFKNQIDFQNAGAALNEELKTQVLADLGTASLTGRTITLTGAFTAINPSAWLITPTELSVQ